MQLSNDRQVNEKSFKTGMNSQNFARFDPLSWEKIAYYYLASQSGAMPSWVIDELQNRNRGRHLNSGTTRSGSESRSRPLEKRG
jgi:hypothetical protein